MDTQAVLGTLFDKFAQFGDLHYGETIAQRAHAEQSAQLAVADGAGDALIVAALLHDFGHFLQRRGEDAADHGIDTRHEVIGANYLARYFVDAVTAPIRLHVEAKRYLCAVEPDYLKDVSAASRQSLMLQGGTMTAHEAAAFERAPFYREAIRLRRYDEGAKQVGLVVAPLASYKDLIVSVMKA